MASDVSAAESSNRWGLPGSPTPTTVSDGSSSLGFCRGVSPWQSTKRREPSAAAAVPTILWPTGTAVVDSD
jgi:hypothetical protein